MKVTGTARRNAFLVIIASVLVVMVPLWITGTRISEDARTEGAAKAIAARWAAGSGYEVRRVTANLDKVVVLITGSGTLPAFNSLESDLKAALQRPLMIVLDVVPAEKFSITLVRQTLNAGMTFDHPGKSIHKEKYDHGTQ